MALQLMRCADGVASGSSGLWQASPPHTVRRMRGDDKPIAGRQLIRAYQGVEKVVTVTRAGYEYQGKPYQSLSSSARAITGTRWNGRVFFGLRPRRSAA